jgi:hypothetical protein
MNRNKDTLRKSLMKTYTMLGRLTSQPYAKGVCVRLGVRVCVRLGVRVGVRVAVSASVYKRGGSI